MTKTTISGLCTQNTVIYCLDRPQKRSIVCWKSRSSNRSGAAAYLEAVYKAGWLAERAFNPLSPAYNSGASVEENQQLATGTEATWPRIPSNNRKYVCGYIF